MANAAKEYIAEDSSSDEDESSDTDSCVYRADSSSSDSSKSFTSPFIELLKKRTKPSNRLKTPPKHQVTGKLYLFNTPNFGKTIKQLWKPEFLKYLLSDFDQIMQEAKVQQHGSRCQVVAKRQNLGSDQYVIKQVWLYYWGYIITQNTAYIHKLQVILNNLYSLDVNHATTIASLIHNRLYHYAMEVGQYEEAENHLKACLDYVEHVELGIWTWGVHTSLAEMYEKLAYLKSGGEEERKDLLEHAFKHYHIAIEHYRNADKDMHDWDCNHPIAKLTFMMLNILLRMPNYYYCVHSEYSRLFNTTLVGDSARNCNISLEAVKEAEHRSKDVATAIVMPGVYFPREYRIYLHLRRAQCHKQSKHYDLALYACYKALEEYIKIHKHIKRSIKNQIIIVLIDLFCDLIGMKLRIATSTSLVVSPDPLFGSKMHPKVLKLSHVLHHIINIHGRRSNSKIKDQRSKIQDQTVINTRHNGVNDREFNNSVDESQSGLTQGGGEGFDSSVSLISLRSRSNTETSMTVGAEGYDSDTESDSSSFQESSVPESQRSEQTDVY